MLPKQKQRLMTKALPGEKGRCSMHFLLFFWCFFFFGYSGVQGLLLTPSNSGITHGRFWGGGAYIRHREWNPGWLHGQVTLPTILSLLFQHVCPCSGVPPSLGYWNPQLLESVFLSYSASRTVWTLPAAPGEPPPHFFGFLGHTW